MALKATVMIPVDDTCRILLDDMDSLRNKEWGRILSREEPEMRPALIEDFQGEADEARTLSEAFRKARGLDSGTVLVLRPEASAEDVRRVLDGMRENPDAVVVSGRIQSRNYSLAERLEQQAFSIAGGCTLRELRPDVLGFPATLVKNFADQKGEGEAFIINCLLSAARGGVRIVEEEGAEYRRKKGRFSDMLTVYLCALKFLASSVASFGIDFVMVLLLNALTASLSEEIRLAVSVVGARIISASVNFTLNRKLVFQGNERLGKALGKYAVLAGSILGLNYLFMRILTILLGWPLLPAKVLVEVVLFLFNYVIQGKFVYRGKKET